MKNIFFLVFALAAACESSAIAEPLTDTASGTNPSDTRMSPVLTDGKCYFILKNVPGQGYKDRGYTFYVNKTDNQAGWGFGFGCYAGTTQAEIDSQWAAKQVNGTWIWEATNEPFTAEQHFKALSFNGRNWKGTSVEYDDTTGDESARGRNLFFCLVEVGGPQVLCGGPISVRSLSDPPTTSTLPKIMAVLKTIEFVDAPSAIPAPAPTATVH